MLVERGDLGLAVSTFPSLTPVCLSTIATGGGPRSHAHPRAAVVPPRRAALRRVRVVLPGDARRGRQAVGRRRGREPQPRAPLAQADHALRGGRGRRHDRGLGQLPRLARPRAPLVQVPDAARASRAARASWTPPTARASSTSASCSPPSAPARPASFGVGGKNDAYAAAVGRWLVARDGFDFLLFYLPETDSAGHRGGAALRPAAVAGADDAIATLMSAAGGVEPFLERYAVVLCADHGQSPIDYDDDIRDAFGDQRLFLARGRTDPETATSRSRPRTAPDTSIAWRAACRSTRSPGACSSGLRGCRGLARGWHAVVRHGGRELRFSPDGRARPARRPLGIEGELATLDLTGDDATRVGDLPERARAHLADPHLRQRGRRRRLRGAGLRVPRLGWGEPSRRRLARLAARGRLARPARRRRARARPGAPARALDRGHRGDLPGTWESRASEQVGFCRCSRVATSARPT